MTLMADPPQDETQREVASLEIRPASAADDEARDAFVRGAQGGTFFHLSGWRRTVERVMRVATAA